MSSIKFDILYIIGPTGNQYDHLNYRKAKAWYKTNISKSGPQIVFIKDGKKLPRPEELPEDLTNKLIIIDDVEPREPIIRKYFCRSRHNICNMIYPNQNLFSLDRQSVRENCNIFVLFEPRGNLLNRLYNDIFKETEIA